MKFKVVIHTGYDYPQYYSVFEEVRDYLIEQGLDCDIIPMITGHTAEDTIKHTRGYHAALTSFEVYNKQVFEALSSDFLVVARLGIGVDTVNLADATEYGVAVTNTPGANASAVADMAVTLMCALNRKLHIFNKKIKAGEWWTSYLGGQMEDATVGLVGFGSIARVAARYLGGFGCKLITYDPYFDEQVGKELNVTSVGLLELAEQSDFVSVHAPLLPATKGLIGKEFFDRMKPTAFFVNTSRGPVVKEEYLISALQQEKIAGAGLDVFEVEPLSTESPLRKMENVILSPHVAGNSLEAVRRVGRIAADSVIEVSKGIRPTNLVNKDLDFSRIQKILDA